MHRGLHNPPIHERRDGNHAEIGKLHAAFDRCRGLTTCGNNANAKIQQNAESSQIVSRIPARCPLCTLADLQDQPCEAHLRAMQGDVLEASKLLRLSITEDHLVKTAVQPSPPRSGHIEASVSPTRSQKYATPQHRTPDVRHVVKPRNQEQGVYK